MSSRSPLVGREQEKAELEAALSRNLEGSGGLLLVSGESGVGKSRLVAEVLRTWDGQVGWGTATPGAGSYNPLLDVLEELSGPLPLDEQGDVMQSFAGRLQEMATARPTVLVLEDLHRAGAAAIELLPGLARSLRQLPMLLIGTYDNPGLPRTHPLRAVRAELRRADGSTEIVASPLGRTETGALLQQLLGKPIAESLVATVHERTDGLPLFVEELAVALSYGDGLVPDGEGRLQLAAGAAIPIPESAVDAVVARTRRLRESYPEALELAAVLGPQVSLPVLTAMVDPEHVDQLLEAGLLREAGPTEASFDHALVRDAIYRTVPWGRRREYHRRVAEALDSCGAAPEQVAEHWLAAHDTELARPLLLAAAERHCSVHAYRDAAEAARRALDIWPEDIDPAGRVSTLERLAECAERSGQLEAAVAVWAEVAEWHQEAEDPERLAVAHRRLANSAELLGQRDRSMTAREAAADAYASAGLPADSAEDRLALGAQLMSAGSLTAALDQVVLAGRDAATVERTDLRARSLSLEGAIRSAMGDAERGVELARSGVDLALSARNTDAAGLSYYDLAEALLYSTDYTASVDMWAFASEFCREHAVTDMEQACLACMSVAVRFQGDWDRALAICGDVLDNPAIPEEVRMVAVEESALITVLRGDHRRGRGPLRRAHAFGRAHGSFGIEVGAAWGLAVVAELEDDERAATNQVAALLDRCAEIDYWMFALPALRWSATYLAQQGERELLERCHRLLGTAATQYTSAKTLAVLAHAGGELLLADKEPGRAAAQFGRAVELMKGAESPYEHAITQLRRGVAWAAADDRQRAVETVSSAYRTARQLGARPLARQCAQALEGIGERVDRRLGRLAARSLTPGGLTRRETEVLRMMATGRTNRQIAEELFVSTRTVDMHVRNLLAKLDCTTRVAATRRASELGLIDSQASPEITA